MIISCAKLFINHTMHNKVMGRTRICFTEANAQTLSVDCDLDLNSSDIIFICDASACHDD